jgi:hypothetical protein
LSYRNQNFLDLSGDAAQSAVTAVLLFLIQAPVEIETPSGDPEEHKNGAKEYQEADCNRDLKNFHGAPFRS